MNDFNSYDQTRSEWLSNWGLVMKDEKDYFSTSLITECEIPAVGAEDLQHDHRQQTALYLH